MRCAIYVWFFLSFNANAALEAHNSIPTFLILQEGFPHTLVSSSYMSKWQPQDKNLKCEHNGTQKNQQNVYLYFAILSLE